MEELTRVRNEIGWSQQKLADESGVNKATINQIERGRRSPNIETLQKLAGSMGREIGDFFPKAQAPLWSDNTTERRASVFADAIATAAERWLQLDATTDARLLLGIIDAALDLEDFIGACLGDPGWWEGLSDQEKSDVVRVTKLLAEVADRHLAHVREKAEHAELEVESEEIERRREKIREWTRQISA